MTNIAQRRAFSFLICAVLTCCAWISAAEDKDLPYEQIMNVVYGETDGVGLVMDVFRPTGKGLKKAFKPSENGKGLGIIHIASGGWDSDRSKIDMHTAFCMYHMFCAKQYTVFAIRPGSKSKFTGVEMLDHCRLAVRYIKAHAEEYGIDPDRLGLMGSSAGGHLSSLLAVTPQDGKPDSPDPLKRFSTRVKAVGVFFPPTDFLDWDGKEPPYEKVKELFYTSGFENHSRDEIRELARQLSPARMVNGKTPPFLIYHGTADPLVPLQQSEVFVKVLKDNGNEAKLIIKKGGQHPWITIANEILDMADWFDQKLPTPEKVD
ncbi:MAG TPA: alpha/beta hydrolase [Candidatus Brocadiia bacterium]|nr:alpha/beta hydrolase [Candidatus Brocadiia bacterium]